MKGCCVVELRPDRWISNLQRVVSITTSGSSAAGWVSVVVCRGGSENPEFCLVRHLWPAGSKQERKFKALNQIPFHSPECAWTSPPLSSRPVWAVQTRWPSVAPPAGTVCFYLWPGPTCLCRLLCRPAGGTTPEPTRWPSDRGWPHPAERRKAGVRSAEHVALQLRLIWEGGCDTFGTWHRQVIFPASGSTVKSIAAVWGDCDFSSFRDSFRA